MSQYSKPVIIAVLAVPDVICHQCPTILLNFNKCVFCAFFAGRKYAMLKLKVLLSTIVRNFKIHSDLTEKDFKLQADIILKREEGFLVRLESRKRGMAKA